MYYYSFIPKKWIRHQVLHIVLQLGDNNNNNTFCFKFLIT